MKIPEVIRWKSMGGLGVAGILMYAFGLSPLAQRSLKDLDLGLEGTRLGMRNVDFSPIGGSLSFHDLFLATVVESEGESEERMEKAFGVERLTLNVDMPQLLRRRLYGEMALAAPAVRLQRRPDGTIVIPGETDPPPPRAPEDWVGSILEWLERIQKIQEKLPRSDGPTPTPTQEEEKERAEHRHRVNYPFAEVSRFAMKRIAGEGLTIRFVDQKPSGEEVESLPPLTNGSIVIENLSEKPHYFHEPIRWTLSGEMAGGTLAFSGIWDMRLNPPVSDSGKAEVTPGGLRFEFAGEDLPLSLLNHLVGDSFPLIFGEGSVSLAGIMHLKQQGEMEIVPLLALRNVNTTAKPGVTQIAGLDAERFVDVLNRVGTLELMDIRISGTTRNPRVDLGNALPELVRSGGRALAEQEADRLLQEGMQRLREEVGDTEELKPLLDATDLLKEDIQEGMGRVLEGFFRRR